MEQIVPESLVPQSLRLCGSVGQSLTDDKIVQIIFFLKGSVTNRKSHPQSRRL